LISASSTASTLPTTSDEELVRLIQRGEPRGLRELMQRHLRGAVAVALEYARDLDEAEDIAQDAFHRVWRAASSFDVGLRFRPWFYTLVRNLGRNAAGKRTRRGEIELVDTHAAPEVIRDAEIRRAINAELSELSEMQRRCFRLCEMEGFTSEEVGDMLDIAPATVRTHTHRARAHLRNALGKYGLP
jgi:RNA polymerase sigma-70 factor (ECF subfamily)